MGYPQYGYKIYKISGRHGIHVKCIPFRGEVYAPGGVVQGVTASTIRERAKFPLISAMSSYQVCISQDLFCTLNNIYIARISNLRGIAPHGAQHASRLPSEFKKRERHYLSQRATAHDKELISQIWTHAFAPLPSTADPDVPPKRGSALARLTHTMHPLVLHILDTYGTMYFHMICKSSLCSVVYSLKDDLLGDACTRSVVTARFGSLPSRKSGDVNRHAESA